MLAKQFIFSRKQEYQSLNKILITGPTTGVQEFTLQAMQVNDVPAEQAKKGDSCTIITEFRTRPSDKLYKVVQA